MAGLQRLPFTYWVALLQEHINQLDDLGSTKALLDLFARRQSWEAAPIFNMSNMQAHYSNVGYPDLAPFCVCRKCTNEEAKLMNIFCD